MGNGMFLEVRPGGKDGKGAKYWRLAYRFDGKQKQLALGVYPDVSLADAREARKNARELLSQGIDPSEAKRVVKTRRANADRFDTVANAWYEQTHQGGKGRAPWSARHADRVRNILDRDLFPVIGLSPINEIKPKQIIEALERVEVRGALQTLLKVRGIAESVFTYAVGRGLAETNPARDVVPSAFKSRPVKHHAAITDPDGVAHLLRAIRGYSGHATVRCALRLMPLAFVRPGELRNAHWAEFDWGARPGNSRRSHEATPRPYRPLVPSGGGNSARTAPINRRRRPLLPRGPPPRQTDKRQHDQCGAARTWFRSKQHDGSWIPGDGTNATRRASPRTRRPYRAPRAHQVRDPLGRAYNRTAFLDERREMMQRWADYLDKLATGGP